MSIFRPKNINRRLVGTATTSTALSGKGSPGNGGQIGPKKVPYLCGNSVDLGSRCQFGSCSGVFKINESQCGLKECCQCTISDCGGTFIHCGPGTVKWFISPSCTEISRCWYCRANGVTVSNSCIGSCGWFIPNVCQAAARVGVGYLFWDNRKLTSYWTDSTAGSHGPGHNGAWQINGTTGGIAMNYNGVIKDCIFCIRAFRCTAT